MSAASEGTIDRFAEIRRLRWLTLAIFFGSWVAAWAVKTQLLLYAVAPFVELWRQQGMPERPTLLLPQPATLLSAYLRVTLTPALLVVLPLLTLMGLGLASPRALAAVKTRARAFLSASYAVIALGAFVTSRFVVPPAAMELLSRSPWWDPSQPLGIESYVAFLVFGVGGVCVTLQLGLATLFIRIARFDARRG